MKTQFTLEEIRAAFKAAHAHPWTIERAEAALLAAKPDRVNIAYEEANEYFGDMGKVAANPEAKTCRHGCQPGCRFKNCCTPSCWPAPAASPPAWLPLGRHPGGECKDNCGKSGACVKWIRSADGWLCHSVGNAPCFCSRYCRDRAKAVPRDAAKCEAWCQPTYPCRRCVARKQPNPAQEACRAPRASSTSRAGGGQPGIPDGFRLAEGWMLVSPDDARRVCWADGENCNASGVLKRNNGTLAARCIEHGKKEGAVIPAEPSRPVTGEAVDWSKFLPTDASEGIVLCEAGDVYRETVSGDVFLSAHSTGGASVYVRDSSATGGKRMLATSRDGHFDYRNWTLIRHADGRWVDGYGPDGPIIPHAPGNHPGTPEANEPWYDGLEDEAPGKPDGQHWKCDRCGATREHGSLSMQERIGRGDYRCPLSSCNGLVQWQPGKPDEAPQALNSEDWHG